jgi:glycosyltransferase involved in cell wall biosynthesis
MKVPLFVPTRNGGKYRGGLIETLRGQTFRQVQILVVDSSSNDDTIKICRDFGRKRGYLIVYTPYAELYHHASLGRDHEDAPEKQVEFKKEIDYFQRKWHDVLAQGDPYYNPNLTLDREDFSIRI